MQTQPEVEFSAHQVTVRQKNILTILLAGNKMTVGEVNVSMENPTSALTVG